MPLQPGQILNNRYRIERLLGQGGFGAVYLATDRNLNAAVAIKESLDTSPASEKQFRSEAGLLFKLHHTNLPRVHDCFAVAGQGLYLAMDYIEGESLERKLERQGGPLPVEQVLAWIGPICDALDYLHRQAPPVIHRDIKPANIIVRSDGCPFLVDFGISKVYDPDRKTTAGARALTPGYSPPEQYGIAATDARSDIYALGATVYHLISGTTPPAAMDIMAGIARPPQPADLLAMGVSAPVSKAVLQALRPNREERWGSAAAFKQALLVVAPLVVQPSKPALQAAPAGAAPLKIDQPRRKAGAGQPTRRTGKGGSKMLWVAGLAALVGLVLLALVAGRQVLRSTIRQTRQTQTAAAAVVDTATARPTSTARKAATATIPAPTEAARPTATLTATLDPSIPPANAQQGDTWTRPADGMVMVYVPEGEFLMGAHITDQGASNDEKPQHTVFLDAFWIDRTEVTNAMFGEFLNQTGYQARVPKAAGDHPVVYVAWEHAVAYCQWAGGSLPTEAQWEKAARGTDGRLYPWGNQPASCTLALLPGGCDGKSPWPVGSKLAGASPYGALDMAGNVAEWVQDWYEKDYYQHSPARNPTGPDKGTGRGLRGGSLNTTPRTVRSSFRNWFNPIVMTAYIGFRCVR